MTRDELNNAYFDWMYQLVCDCRIVSFYICFMIQILRLRLPLMVIVMTMESIFGTDSEMSKDTGIV